MITDTHNLQDCTYDRHDDATQPYVHVTGSATNVQLSNFPTGVPTPVDYGTDPNSPVFHDGDTWYDQSSATAPLGEGGDGGSSGGGGITGGKVWRDSIVDAGADDFDTIQDAIAYAYANDYPSVFVRPGTYEESITVPLQMTVFSSGRRGAELNPSEGPAATLEHQATLQQVTVTTQNSGGLGVLMTGNVASVQNCYVLRDVLVEGNRCSVRDSYLTNNQVQFAEETQNGLVDGNVFLGGVWDKGNNTVGSNS